jgi:hypothetical protein
VGWGGVVGVLTCSPAGTDTCDGRWLSISGSPFSAGPGWKKGWCGAEGEPPISAILLQKPHAEVPRRTKQVQLSGARCRH